MIPIILFINFVYDYCNFFLHIEIDLVRMNMQIFLAC